MAAKAMTLSNELRVTILLSLQRAMLGETFGALRSLHVEVDGTDVVILCYVERSLSESDRESVFEIESELQADLPREWVATSEIIEWPFPQIIPDRGIPVYRRKE